MPLHYKAFDKISDPRADPLTNFSSEWLKLSNVVATVDMWLYHYV